MAKLMTPLQLFRGLPYESFIGGWFIDESICDELIDFHKNSSNKVDGKQEEDGKLIINKNIKDSTDVGIWPKDFSKYECIDFYMKNVFECLRRYGEKYPYAVSVPRFGIKDSLNIQYYKPGGGYKRWHFENGSIRHLKRHLVFMTYLNDVEDGGTEFYYQNICTPAKKGLTVIWPATWTHIHKGQITKKNEKYIATGWFEFE